MIKLLTMVGYLNLFFDNPFLIVTTVFIIGSLIIKICKSESKSNTKHEESPYDSGIWEDRKTCKQKKNFNYEYIKAMETDLEQYNKIIGFENEKRIKDVNDIRMLTIQQQLKSEPKWNKEAEKLYDLLIMSIENQIMKNPMDTSITIYALNVYQDYLIKGIHYGLDERYINSDYVVKRKFKELIIKNGFEYSDNYFFITITWEPKKNE